MARTYTRVHRLLRLIRAIQSRQGLGPAELARLCEVHERTIYRDIDTLNASGVPCAFEPAGSGYRIHAGFFMPPIELTFEESLALVAMVEQVAGEGQIPFLGMAARAAEKIRSQLPTRILTEMEPLDGNLKIELPATMADESCRDVYDQVRDAIANRRSLVCVYESINSTGTQDGADGEFEFRPYAIWFCQRAWYAVGHHGGRDAIRRLKLNRFISIRNGGRPYAIPDDFDPRADLALAWRIIRGATRYQVAVRFEPAFADNASETRWHPTQEEQWDDDGRVTLRFTVDGLEEIVWWVLGYGPGATVLEPTELVERVQDLARQTLVRYEPTAD